MSQAEQMALAMEMSKATQQAALTDVKKMANDPEAVKIAADHYADYQMKQASGGITAQYSAINDIQQKVSTRSMEISEKASKALKCSDGEGGCASKADEAADKATLRAAHAQIVAEYDRALVQIGPLVEAARKARLADIAAVQKDMGATQYGAAAQSSANKQLLATYHNTALIEVEQLFMLSEDVAKWAAGRSKDRTINFMPRSTRWSEAPVAQDTGNPSRHHLNEAEGGVREVADVRQDARQFGRAAAEPARQRRGELIDRGRRQQPALPHLVVGLDRHMRRGAVELPAIDRAAHHEVVAAPAVVGAVGVRAQRAAEVRRGEGGDLVGHAQLDRRRIERAHRIVDALHAAAGGPA